MAKNKARMTALRDEAKAEEPQNATMHEPGTQSAGEPEPQPQATMPEPSMADFCRMPVMLLGGTICGGAGVTPLTPEEIDRLSGALAAVLTVNGMTIKDPRIATAIVLGGVVAQVAYPRVVEYRVAQAKAREEMSKAFAEGVFYGPDGKPVPATEKTDAQAA